MRITVIGAGILGVTSAWYLAGEGHEVTVLDRAEAVAAETSHANAGLVVASTSGSWASPQAIRILIGSLFKEHPAFGFRWDSDPHFWLWGLEFLRNCTWARNRRNAHSKLMLAMYSRDQILELERELDLAYQRNTAGALYLHRDEAALDAHAAGIERLSELGITLRRLTRDQLAAAEPALGPTALERLVGAVQAPADFSGDCRLFTQQLAEAASTRHGTTFRLGETVTGLEIEASRVRAVSTDAGLVPCDAVVIAMGPETPNLLRRIGVRVPIYPVKGYSLTYPLAEAGVAPVTCGIDEHYFASYSRLGDALRITARAEFSGFDRSAGPRDFERLRVIGEELFPQAADFSKPREWVCLRPLTPGGFPIIGRVRSAPDNLWVNAGHGSLGWTMGAGSARILADLMGGRRPAIDPKGLHS